MGATPRRLRDYCILLNPYFPTPQIFDSLRARFQAIVTFYPASNQDIAARLADFVGLDANSIVLGNGATELISWINRLMVTESLAVPVPTFSRWTEDPGLSGKTLHTFVREPRQDFRLTPDEFVAGVRRQGARAAVLCNPDNPTGSLMEPSGVLRVLEALADLDVVVIDESFIDFAAEEEIPSIEREVTRFPNAVVLKSLGSSLGLHGLRMGYAVAHPDLAGRLRAALPYWNLNSVAQAVIEELVTARDDYECGRRQVVRDRIYLSEQLCTAPGLCVYPAQANFVFVRMPPGIEGVSLRNHLLVEHGCLLRECSNDLGSDSSYFRIAARPRAEVDQLIQYLGESLPAVAASPTLGPTRPGAIADPAAAIIAFPAPPRQPAATALPAAPVIPSPEAVLQAVLPRGWRPTQRSGPMTAAISGLLTLALGLGMIVWLREARSNVGAPPGISAVAISPEAEATPPPPRDPAASAATAAGEPGAPAPALEASGSVPSVDQSEDRPQLPLAEPDMRTERRPVKYTKTHRKHTRVRRDRLREQEFGSPDRPGR